jgi:chaperonin GroES
VLTHALDAISFLSTGSPDRFITQVHSRSLSMKIRPLHDRVIIKRLEEDRTSPGGILIPDTAAEKPVMGKVVAIGKGKILEDGKVRALDVKVGDKILFGKYSGTEVKVDGEDLVVMREEDVMAVVEGK